MGGFEISQGNAPTGMDIGSLGNQYDAPTAAVEPIVSELMATVNGMKNALATLVSGKAGPPGITRSPDGRKGKGKDGKGGKGKGKGQKAKGRFEAAQQRPGTAVFHKYSETGRCPHYEQYGWCKFKHVKNVPKSLSGVEGLRLED